MEVKIKRLNEKAILPKYGTEYSAGADLYNLDIEDVEIAAHQTVLIHTGIAMEIPVGYVGLVFARSGIATKKGLAPANKVGVIDSDYRGEIMVALHNHSDFSACVEKGERVAQICIAPYLKAQFFEVEELNETSRGSGGFGSTGTK